VVCCAVVVQSHTAFTYLNHAGRNLCMSLSRFILNGKDIFIFHFRLDLQCLISFKVELGRDKVQRKIRLTISPLFQTHYGETFDHLDPHVVYGQGS
jgi:peptidyl-tRNA hydrolase